jgi:hypothetical protein
MPKSILNLNLDLGYVARKTSTCKACGHDVTDPMTYDDRVYNTCAFEQTVRNAPFRVAHQIFNDSKETVQAVHDADRLDQQILLVTEAMVKAAYSISRDPEPKAHPEDVRILHERLQRLWEFRALSNQIRSGSKALVVLYDKLEALILEGKVDEQQEVERAIFDLRAFLTKIARQRRQLQEVIAL